MALAAMAICVTMDKEGYGDSIGKLVEAAIPHGKVRQIFTGNGGNILVC